MYLILINNELPVKVFINCKNNWSCYNKLEKSTCFCPESLKPACRQAGFMAGAKKEKIGFYQICKN
jgi:hypothetical protein